MSFKYINILLTSVCFVTNDVHSLDYYTNVVLPNMHNLENNNSQLQHEYINNQNEKIYKKIDEKLENARQLLDSGNGDEELKQYIEKLEDLKAKQNISQEVDINELIEFGLLESNMEQNDNTDHSNNIMQNNNLEQNNNIEQIEANNNQDENQNNNPVQHNNVIGENMINDVDPLMNINDLQALGEIFPHFNVMILNEDGIIPINFNNIEDQLNMKTSFENLLKNIKNENRIKTKNNIIKEFLGYIFGDNFYNLNIIFWNASINQLKTVKEILELNDVLEYMKKYDMDVESKLTTLVNTFIEQCQFGYYGDIQNRDDFNKLFDKFFEETKKNQYMEKIEKANNILEEIRYDITNTDNETLKNQVLKLLDKHFKAVTEHINNMFKKLSNKKEECYKQFNNKNDENNSKLKFEIVETKDTNYKLKQILYPIMYEINNSTMNYKNLGKNCCKLRKYLFDKYNMTYFKIHLQTDISALKFKINQINLVNDEKDKKLQIVLDHSQDETMNEDDFYLLLKQYTKTLDTNIINKYCKAHNNYFYSNENFIQKLEQDVCSIKIKNKLNNVNDQLKLDLLDKIKEQKYAIDNSDTYLLTEILYSLHK